MRQGRRPKRRCLRSSSFDAAQTGWDHAAGGAPLAQDGICLYGGWALARVALRAYDASGRERRAGSPVRDAHYLDPANRNSRKRRRESSSLASIAPKSVLPAMTAWSWLFRCISLMRANCRATRRSSTRTRLTALRLSLVRPSGESISGDLAAAKSISRSS